MRTTSPLPLLMIALLAQGFALSLSGCYATSTGYHGKFTFGYAAGIDFQNFVKPIAPGAKLDVVVFANGTENKLVLVSAKSSKPGVLAIEKVNNQTLVVKGGEPGVADVEITARDERGNTLVDTMFFHVEKPAVHKIEHACTERKDAIYVRGAEVDVYHGLATSDARPVIGYGYVPLKIEPANALELVAQPQGAPVYVYRAPKKNTKIAITSTVDGTALGVTIVDRGELKQARLSGDNARLFEGQSRYIVAEVSMGETPVCSQDARTLARSLTPDICTVTAKLDDDEKDENRYQLAEITGLKFGSCKYELSLPELDGGRGVKLTGTAQVGRYEFPDGSRDAAVTVATPPKARGASWILGTIALLVGVGFLLPNLVTLLAMAGLRLVRRTKR